MDILFWLFFGVGILVVFYWLISVIIGMFGDKVAIGRKYIEKRLRENGIDPSTLSRDQLTRIAFNAYSVTQYGPTTTRGFDNAEFIDQLEFRIHIVVSTLRGAPLDPDSAELAKILLDTKPFPS